MIQWMSVSAHPLSECRCLGNSVTSNTERYLCRFIEEKSDWLSNQPIIFCDASSEFENDQSPASRVKIQTPTNPPKFNALPSFLLSSPCYWNTHSRSSWLSSMSLVYAVPEHHHAAQVNNKVALITGITGQDGSYLTEFLLAKGKFPLFHHFLFETMHSFRNPGVYINRIRRPWHHSSLFFFQHWKNWTLVQGPSSK